MRSLVSEIEGNSREIPWNRKQQSKDDGLTEPNDGYPAAQRCFV